jgi:amino acid permease
VVLVRTFLDSCPSEACSKNQPLLRACWPLSFPILSMATFLLLFFLWLPSPPTTLYSWSTIHSHWPSFFSSLPLTILPHQASGSWSSLLEYYPLVWLWISPCIHPLAGP